MNSSYPHHLPRLYVQDRLANEEKPSLSEGQSHYVRHVLRLEEGAELRVFNPQDGEWRGAVSFPSKKSAVIEVKEKLRDPAKVSTRVHLVFSPIKKDRMDWLIEKSVELGATDLHTVLMRRSVVRDVKADRINAQIIEAAEQCERLDLPVLHPLLSLEKFLQQFDGVCPLYAAIERSAVPLLSEAVTGGDAAFLVGPEGGFDPEETKLVLAQKFTRPVSLGPRILRAETAALYGLSVLGR